ncbi:MAG: YwaF family protein [Clostridia bacterium]|nr:YwaF family protein [Clostridia bacterium]
MNLFEKITHFLDADMQIPTAYGVFHIASILITLIVSLFLVVKFKSADEKAFKRIVFFIWIAILILEVYKQINVSFEYNGGDPVWRYKWFAFPFQLCSTPLYVLPLILLLRDSDLRDSLIAFSSHFLFLAGIAVMVYPGNVFVSTIGINIQTMIHHGSQVVLGIYFGARYMKRSNFSFFFSSLKVMLALTSFAVALNITVHHLLTSAGINTEFNMFYISPYFNMTLPVFNDIVASLPYPVFLFGYLFVLTLGSLLIFLLWKLIGLIYAGIKTFFALDCITPPSVIFFIIGVTVAVLIQLSSGSNERILSYGLIVLCAFFALIFNDRSNVAVLTAIALVFTVLADTFLVLMTDGNKLIAMLFFSVVQLLYFIRVFSENRTAGLRGVHIAVRVLVLATSLAATLYVLGERSDALSIASMLYFANLIVNVIFSFFNFKKASIFAIGLLLFAFCDVFVGLSMIGEYISLSEGSLVYKVLSSKINLVWLFYAPSQILIALSAERVKR